MKYFILTILSTLTIVFSACDSVESLGLKTSSDDTTVADNQKLKKRITELEKQNATLLQQNKQLEAEINNLEQEYEELEAQIASLEQEYEEILTVTNSERPEPNNSVDSPTPTPTPQHPLMYRGQMLNINGYSLNDIDGCTLPHAITPDTPPRLMNHISIIGRLIAPVDVGSLEIPVKLILPEVKKSDLGVAGLAGQWVEVETQEDLLQFSYQSGGELRTESRLEYMEYFAVYLCGMKHEPSAFISEDKRSIVDLDSCGGNCYEELYPGRYGMSEVDPDNPVLLFFFQTKLTGAYPAGTLVVFQHMTY